MILIRACAGLICLQAPLGSIYKPQLLQEASLPPSDLHFFLSSYLHYQIFMYQSLGITLGLQRLVKPNPDFNELTFEVEEGIEFGA